MGNKGTLEFYPDAKGKWRWRVISPNGKIIASSGQGFASKQGAQRNALLSGFS